MSQRVAHSGSLTVFLVFVHLVLRHLDHLGFWVKWDKNKLSSAQSISYLSLELDSVSMTGCLTNEQAQSASEALRDTRDRRYSTGSS